MAASYAKILLNYAAKSGNAQARTVGEGLLDAMLAHTDAIGIAVPETRADYNRFDDEYNAGTGEGVYVPPGWTGEMPNGDPIAAGADFLSIRSFYQRRPGLAEGSVLSGRWAGADVHLPPVLGAGRDRDGVLDARPAVRLSFATNAVAHTDVRDRPAGPANRRWRVRSPIRL